MSRRGKFLFILFILQFFLVLTRLFYWQVIHGENLKSQAESQYFETLILPASRGEILANDGFSLVNNQPAYLLYAQLKKTNSDLSSEISKVLDVPEASISAKLQPGLFWTALAHKVSQDKIDEISKLNIPGVGWSPENNRFYPEASTAAQLLGFVGSDENGLDKGYFGLEGYYDLELKGKPGSLKQEKDVRGMPIIFGGRGEQASIDGRTLVLNLDRTVQYIIETKLKDGIEKYGAKEGSVVVMDPKTGGILGMASYPSYDPENYSEFPTENFKNPIVADSYEPGSTFKVLVMAAAIDAGVLKPTDIYDDKGPVKVDKYLIRTWNDQYHGEENPAQILARSCNTGMVWIGRKLGTDKLFNYLKNYGIGDKTSIDLQDEATVSIRPKNTWGEVDLATASFGQGIVVTPIQLLRAISVVANGGKLMEPHVVSKIKDPSGKEITISPKVIRQVIKPETAKVMTDLMAYAVDNGEAKFAKPKGFKIAGKTGTAQIAVSGHYDSTRTIASFVGFAPADDPKFVMLVRLTDPSSSEWGSETAAPLFFDIARDLFNYYGIAPSN